MFVDSRGTKGQGIEYWKRSELISMRTGMQAGHEACRRWSFLISNWRLSEDWPLLWLAFSGVPFGPKSPSCRIWCYCRRDGQTFYARRRISQAVCHHRNLLQLGIEEFPRRKLFCLEKKNENSIRFMISLQNRCFLPQTLDWKSCL